MAHTAIRGVAALCVVVYHVSLSFREVMPGLHQGFAAHSYVFVDMFFILSGYILCRKYQSWFNDGIKPAAVQRFLTLRFARLYPNYVFWFLFALFVDVAIDTWRGRDQPAGTTVSILMHLTATQGIFDSPQHWNIPLWSIGVEFVLYAMFPFLGRFLGATGRLGAAVLALAALAAVFGLSASGTIDIITGGLSVLRGCASFSLGMIIARYFRDLSRFSDAVLSTLQIGFCALAGLAVQMGLEFAAICCFCGIVCLAQVNRGLLYRVLRLPLPQLIGQLSYSIYLSHATLAGLVLLTWYKLDSHLHAGPLAGFVAVGLGTILVSSCAAYVSHRYLEIPAQAFLKRRLLGLTPRTAAAG